MKIKLRLILWFALSAILTLAGKDFYRDVILSSDQVSPFSKRAIVFWCCCGCLFMLALALFWLLQHEARWQRILQKTTTSQQHLPIALRGLLGSITVLLPIAILLYTPVGNYFTATWLRISWLLCSAFLCTLLLVPLTSARRWWFGFSVIALTCGTFFNIADWMTTVSSYPFSIGWSEGNRFWDYSMLFTADHYQISGNKPATPFITIGRQLIWAVAFLIPGLDIRSMRLWDALTWIIPPLLLGFTLVYVPSRGKRNLLASLIFAAWTLIFLNQGPVYSPLVISTLLVALALRLRSLPLSILLIVTATYYNFITRWTWSYAPGLWGGLFALLSLQQIGFHPRFWKNYVRPLALGIAGYFGVQILPQWLEWLPTGVGTVQTTNNGVMPLFMNPTVGVTRQPILWERLLPNSTYAPGILLASLLVALPLFMLCFWLWKSRMWRPHWLQAGCLLAITFLFWGVGLVISVKIGGGSNLHNLDLFWVTLALLAGWLWREVLYPQHAQLSGVIAAEEPLLDAKTQRTHTWLSLTLCLVLFFPAAHVYQFGKPFFLPPTDKVERALQIIQAESTVALQKGEVLYIDQRQLLVFNFVQGIPLVSEYEKKLLMDSAMADDAAYFEPFHQDLARKRFSLIISEPFYAGYADDDGKSFAEENNVWVKWVAVPVLKYYRPYYDFEEVGVQLLIPKK